MKTTLRCQSRCAASKRQKQWNKEATHIKSKSEKWKITRKDGEDELLFYAMLVSITSNE